MLSEAKHLDLFFLANPSKSDQRFFALLRMTLERCVNARFRVICVSRG